MNISPPGCFPPYETIPVLRSAEPIERPAVAGWGFRAATYLLSQPVDQAISSILTETGEMAGADRAWMFEYDESLLRFRNTHEWSRAGVRSHVEDLQDTPVTMIAWLHRFLIQGEAVMINDVASLPRTARSLQAEMLRQQDKSVLSVPVFHQGKLRACIGFDATAAICRWSAETIRALAECADLIALARYSSRTGESAKPFAPLFYLQLQGRVRGVAPEDIIGLRSAGDYTDLSLSDGSVTTDRRGLSVWIGMLPKAMFMRINRTVVVNLLHIRGLDRHAGVSGSRWEVRLHAVDRPWTVSRPYRAELRARLGI